MVTGRMPTRFHQHSLCARPEGHLLGSPNRAGSILQTVKAEWGGMLIERTRFHGGGRDKSHI